MKRKEKTVVGAYLLLILVTAVFFIWSGVSEYANATESDDIFMGNGTFAISFMVFLPVVIAEIDLLFDTLYFIKKDCTANKANFVFHVVSATFAVMLPLSMLVSNHVSAVKLSEMLVLIPFSLYFVQKIAYGVYKLSRA